MGRYWQSKINKTKALLRNERLRKHVPLTQIMTKESLLKMLQTYRMVYVKPNAGTYGNGVMRVEQKSGAPQPYRYQAGVKVYKFEDFPSLYNSIRRMTRGRRYLVQQGIDLLTYRGNRFDLRVMVQQSPQQKWETTGIIGRVAHPRKIVTNYHNGGRLKSLEPLLASYVPQARQKRYVDELSRLGRRVARQLQSVQPGLKELGLDVALDRDLKPWILEVNTAPDPYIFRKLKDKRIFAKVIRYHRVWKPKRWREKAQ